MKEKVDNFLWAPEPDKADQCLLWWWLLEPWYFLLLLESGGGLYLLSGLKALSFSLLAEGLVFLLE